MRGHLAYVIASWIRNIYGAPADPPQAMPPRPEPSSMLTELEAGILLDEDVVCYGEAL